MDFLLKIVKIYVSQDLWTLPKTFYPVFKQKLFGLRDAHWIACTSSREFFRVLSVVVGWSGGSIFRVDHFFSNCFCPLR